MNISIPVKIITPKIALNKQNSLFYAGKNIAEVKILNRTYVLRTYGQYQFSLENQTMTIESDDNLDDKARAIISELTDYLIKHLDDQGNIQNWGWFGINAWESTQVGVLFTDPKFKRDTLLPIVFNCYSEYDVALKAFIKEVTKNIQGAQK